MRRALRVLLLLSFGLLVAPRRACGARDDIDELLDRYVAAYNNGDASAMAVLYSDDAVLLPNDQSGARGRSKIEQFWKRTLRFDPARRMGRSVPREFKTRASYRGFSLYYAWKDFPRLSAQAVASRPAPREFKTRASYRGFSLYYAWKDFPQPQPPVELGLVTEKPAPRKSST